MLCGELPRAARVHITNRNYTATADRGEARRMHVRHATGANDGKMGLRSPSGPVPFSNLFDHARRMPRAAPVSIAPGFPCETWRAAEGFDRLVFREAELVVAFGGVLVAALRLTPGFTAGLTGKGGLAAL